EDAAVNPNELDEWLPPEPAAHRGNGANGSPFRMPPRIQDGARNDTLYRSARSMHAKGWSDAAIVAALIAQKPDRVDPPLLDAEVQAIARHAVAQPDREDFGPPPDLHADDPLVFAEPCPAFLARLTGQDRPPDLVAQLIPSVGTGMIHGQPRGLKT